MATKNRKIELAYAIGKIKNEHELVRLGEILGEEYKRYTLTIHSGLNGYNTYVLYKDLGERGASRKVIEVTMSFTLSQIIHIIEEALYYDKTE